MNYDQAKVKYEQVEKPVLEDFIKHAKENFVFIQLAYGSGFALQAIEIAEELAKLKEKE
jgi:hypothetical protein